MGFLDLFDSEKKKRLIEEKERLLYLEKENLRLKSVISKERKNREDAQRIIDSLRKEKNVLEYNLKQEEERRIKECKDLQCVIKSERKYKEDWKLNAEREREKRVELEKSINAQVEKLMAEKETERRIMAEAEERAKEEELRRLKACVNYELLSNLIKFDKIVLGYTSWEEAKKNNFVVSKSKFFSGYEMNISNYHFYDENSSGYFSRMYAYSDQYLPKEWEKIGIFGGMSYNRWISFFNKNGFNIYVKKEPVVSDGKFSSIIQAYDPNKILHLELRFSGGSFRRTDANSDNTCDGFEVKIDLINAHSLLEYLYNSHVISNIPNLLHIAPDSSTIASEAYKNNFRLKTILIPEGIEEIGEEAFMGCRNLESVVFPKSLRVIGQSAFKDCINLKFVGINEGLASIGYLAFYNTNLFNIYIPKSVDTICVRSFECCCEVSSENKEYRSNGGVLFDINNHTLYSYPTNLNKDYYEIPIGVKTIIRKSFENNNHLKVIKIPNTTKYIGDNTFANCKSLEYFNIPLNSSIEANICSGCKSLKGIFIENSDPYGIKIDVNAFSSIDKSKCTLYVLQDCKPKFVDRNEFADFGQIISCEQSIDDIIQEKKDIIFKMILPLMKIGRCLLGVTTEEQMAKFGFSSEESLLDRSATSILNALYKSSGRNGTFIEKKKHSSSLSYLGVTLWDHDADGIFESVSCGSRKKILGQWNDWGLGQSLSFEEWLEMFQNRGFEVKITKMPNIYISTFGDNKTYYTASFEAYYEAVNVILQLEIFEETTIKEATMKNQVCYLNNISVKTDVKKGSPLNSWLKRNR